PLVFRHELCGHGSHRACKKEIEQEGFDRVVAMVPERDLRTAEVFCDVVEDAAPQSRAERTVGLSLRDPLFDDGIGVFSNDPVGNAALGQELFKGAAIVARLYLVEVHRDELKADGCSAPGSLEQMQQGV